MFDTYFQPDILSKAPSEDVKNYLLATSNFGKGMQDDIYMYVTRYRLNNTTFRQRPNPIAKNIFTKQNPIELDFKDISNFHTQNPITGSLLREINVGKKEINSKLLKKAPKVTDVLLKARLDALRRYDDNNNIPPPPPLPKFFPPPLPSPPTNFPPPTNYPGANLPSPALPPDLFQPMPLPPP